MSVIEKLETPTAVTYIQDGIFRIDIKEDAIITLEAAEETFEARKKLQKEEKMLVLMDARKVWQVSKEARKFGANTEVAKLNLAKAIVTGNSLTVKMLGNFFIQFNKPPYPIKLFKSKTKALKWLATFN